MLSDAAKLYGIVFLIVGTLGFVPSVTPNGYLLGLFHVNGSHNVIHLLTGVLALVVGFVGGRASRVFFLCAGIVYGLLSFFGFFAVDRPLFGVMAHNYADAWLHLAMAAVSIFLGISPEKNSVTGRERAA